MNKSSNARSLAAIDLGSNSFHMIVGRLKNGQLQLIDRLREPGGRRLVVDIGGGSTELIIGEGFEAIHTGSMPQTQVPKIHSGNSARRHARICNPAVYPTEIIGTVTP